LNRPWQPAILGYFGYRASNSSMAKRRAGGEGETLKVQLEKLKAERAPIEKRVALFKPDSLLAEEGPATSARPP
jgi:hypothetical protein